MFKIIIVLLCLCAFVGCKSKASDEANSKTDASKAESPKVEEKANTESKDAPKAQEDSKLDEKSAPQPEKPQEAPATAKAQPDDEDEAGEEDEEEEYDDEDFSVPQDGTIEEKIASLKWEPGIVSRFDFDYESPSFMKEMPAPANNDGSTYRWKDMAFKVWGAHDMYDGSVQKAFESSVEFLGHAPHYKLVKDNSFIISDYTKDGLIFYRKCVYKYEYEFCEQLEYPKEYKQAVEPMVKKVAAFDVTRAPEMAW